MVKQLIRQGLVTPHPGKNGVKNFDLENYVISVLEKDTCCLKNVFVDSINVSGGFTESATTGITAFATGGQTSAVQLSSSFNEITTSATAGDSVKLPTASAGLRITVKNNGATSANVFPFLGDSINTLGVNTAIALTPGSTKTFVAVSSTVWEESTEKISVVDGTVGAPSHSFNTDPDSGMYIIAANNIGIAVNGAKVLDIGTAGLGVTGLTTTTTLNTGATVFTGINTYKATTTLTALAGGAQAGTALASEYNEFTVVATTGDSAQLPVGVLGKKVIVKNSAAISMNVFGQTGAAIDGAAANAAFAVKPGQEITFEAISATVWNTKEGTSLGTISAVTQATSITTGVTVNSKKGIITTFTPSTAGLAATTFTVTNNKTTATSNIRAYVTDYGGTVITNGLPYVFVKNQTANTFDIIVYNAHATNALATSLKIGFEIIN